MTDFDLDRLGDVWRQQLDPAEMERLQRTAAAVGRRARWAQFIDAGAALAVASVVILLVAANPQTDTFLLGAAAIVGVLGSHVRQRKLRRLELGSLTGGTEDMLNQSIARVEARMKRTRYGLFVFGPALLVGWMFMHAVTGRPLRGLLPDLFDEPWFRFLWSGGWAVAVAMIMVAMFVSLRRSRRELERLVAMRDAYRDERESTT